MSECIHGFEQGLCDTCYPRVAPEPVRPARSTSVRTPRAAARVPGTRSTTVGAVGAPPSLKLPGRRVYHVTHIRTLESIAHDGALVAGAEPVLDVSSATTRELRASATVPDGRSVTDFVSFSLSQDATRWQELRSGAVGTHWSDGARATKPTDFVILAVPVDALGSDVVFVDSDAAATVARFSAGLEEGTHALRRLHASDPDFRDAELLVAESVDIEHVAIVTVANDKVRDRVRELFAGAGQKAPRIAVYPPSFQPVDELA